MSTRRPDQVDLDIVTIVVITALSNARAMLPAELDGLGRLSKMYRVPTTGPTTAAVAGQLERGVRRRRHAPMGVQSSMRQPSGERT